MTIFRNLNTIEGSYTACIGFFDGVHLGHRFLLEKLQQEARSSGTLSAVITFSNHPRRLIQPDYKLSLINTLDEKLERLAATGIDACFLLDFTEEIRNLSAKEFICDLLAAKAHVKRLLIGYDHRFGKNREECFEDYVRYGKLCGVEVLQESVFDDGSARNYSSSEVRRALIAGDIAHATEILGAPYILSGIVIHGKKLGRSLSFPTANLQPSNPDKIIPTNGVYACMVRLADGREFPAMVNIGFRPTVDFSSEKLSVEAHLIGFEGDLYDQTISVVFFKRMRDERKMSSLIELKEQLAKDAALCSSVLSNHPED